MLKHRLRSESGAAVVDFVLIAVLLTGLTLALVQLCIVLYVRNVLVATAAEGARFGANANRTESDAADKTRELVATALTGSIQPTVTAELSQDADVAVVRVEVTATLPLFGFAGPANALTVSGRAIKEGP